MLLTGLVLSVQTFAAAALIGKTDKDPLAYKVGEEMAFALRLVEAPALPEGAYLRWKTSGDDGRRQQGRAEVPGADGLVVRTRLTHPGFVRLEAEIVDRDGKSLEPRLLFEGGAAAEPEKLQGCEAPSDKAFKAFWKRQRARLRAVEMKVRKAEVKSAYPGIRACVVEIACAGPRLVTGELTVPTKPGKFAARLDVDGYGFYPPNPEKRDPIWRPDDKIYLHVNAHGFKMPEFGADKAYYDDFGKSLDGYGFEKTDDPEALYFNGMALRVMRALEFLKSLPEWDGQTLEVSGGSQGGLQTMWAAALEPSVTHVTPHVVWCCDLASRDKQGRLGGWRPEWRPSLGYYDPVNMAKWVRKTCTVDITRVGLGDYIAPPSSVTVLYNNLKCPKSIRYVQGANHYVDPPKPYVESVSR